MTVQPLQYRAPPTRRAAPPRIGWGSVGVLAGDVAAVAAFAAVSLPLAGMLYVFGVLAVTAVRPDVTFFLIFLEAPLVWDLGGGGPVRMAAGDLTLVLAMPVLVVRFALSGRRLSRNPMLWPTLAYFAICVASAVLNNGSPLVGAGSEAVTSIFQMALYMVVAVYLYANTLDGPGQVVPALYALLATNVFIAGAVLALRSTYVLGLHKNATGAELSYAVTVAAELWLARAAAGRSRRALTAVLLVLVAGLVNSLSRGAWLGAAVGVLVLLVLRRRVALAVRGGLLLAPVVAVCWALLPAASKEYATDLGHGARNIEARYKSLSFAWDLFCQNPVFGVGVGLRKVYDATNLALATLAETGVLGMVTFVAVFAAFGWMVVRARRRLSPTDPAFSLVAIGAALMVGKVAHGMVDHYWSRVMLPVWAAAGLAVYGYNLSLGRAKPAATVVRRRGGGRP